MTDMPSQPPAEIPPQTPAATAPAPQAPAGPQAKPTISYDDFVKLDLRVARVLEVVPHPNADKLLCLTVDMGSEKRQIIAGIRAWYSPETLVGKDVVVVANLQPRKMRGLESNGMVLAASTPDEAREVVVLTVDRPVPPGSTVS